MRRKGASSKDLCIFIFYFKGKEKKRKRVEKEREGKALKNLCEHLREVGGERCDCGHDEGLAEAQHCKRAIQLERGLS